MTRLTTLLAATDLSAPSRHAAQRAAMLAAETGARLELLHVLERGALDELRRFFGDDDADVGQRIRDQARESLDEFAAELCSTWKVGPGVHLKEGGVLDTIAAEADGRDASLLVLGARGADFMRQWLLGATAERLLRKLRRPILLVKLPPHEHYRRVLVPVDFSRWSLDAIRLARVVAPHAELLLMHAFELPYEGKLKLAFVDSGMLEIFRAKARREAVDHLHRLAEEAGIAGSAWRAEVIHGDTALRVLEQEEELGADLIVLGKHGEGMVEELLLGGVTKHVLAHARCDVLAAC